MKTKLGYFYLIIISIIMESCSNNNHRFDEQAHRGGRGLMPENTIASQKNAIDYKSTMEMDLQMTKDKKVVVSHDPYINSLFCLTPRGKTMTKKEGQNRLIYDMPYDSVAQYDCGSKPNPNFPKQKNIPTVIPLLDVLIDSVEAYAKTKNHENHYNIELKSRSSRDGKAYPTFEEYVDSVMAIINEKGIASRTMMQSFEVRALQRVHDKWPNIKISFLIGKNNKKDIEDYIDELGFKPDIFSPNYHLCTKERIKKSHDEGIRIIPYTPNTVEKMQELKDMGVDGVITDYPNYFSKLE